MQQNNHPFVIGIGGGTGSGKTSLAQRLVESQNAVLLTHDRYYHTVSDPDEFNFDHPDALETKRMVFDLKQLKKGEAVDLPVYDFSRHCRLSQTERLEPHPLIVAEGILILADPEVRNLLDLAVYVDTPDDIRLIRRLQRDTIERGRTMESVLKQYLKTVRPMHEMFVHPSKKEAQIVLDGMLPLPELIQILTQALPFVAK
jgi:uridine kinase